MKKFTPRMKSLHSVIHPSTWSFSVKLTMVMLCAALLPIALMLPRLSDLDERTFILIGGLIVLMSLLLSHHVAKPIHLLVKAARSLERGNFAPEALTEMASHHNDISYLAQVFSKLAARVKATQEQQMRQQVTEVLLQELNHRDLDWLTAVGHCREIDPGTLLMQEGQAIDAVHLVLEGTFSLTCARFTGSYLNRAFLDRNHALSQEIARLGSGEVIGDSCFVSQLALEGNSPAAGIAPATAEALEPSLVLSIPRREISRKLKQDIGFAARFYRSLAILLSNRWHYLVSQIGDRPFTQEQSLRDVLFVLGALNDSDIDWLVMIGQRQKLPAETVLVQQGRPVEALYILLNGSLTVSVAETVCNPFVRAFSVNRNHPTSRGIARLSKGEMVGEGSFLHAPLSATTVIAAQDSLVLAIPRSHLIVKLEEDLGFASRFYQVLSDLVADRLQDLLDQLGYGEAVASPDYSHNGASVSNDELNFNVLDQMAIAGTRFDWMLRRLGGTEPA